MAENYGIRVNVDENVAEALTDAANAALDAKQSIDELGTSSEASLSDVGSAVDGTTDSLKSIGEIGADALAKAREAAASATQALKETGKMGAAALAKTKEAATDTAEALKDAGENGAQAFSATGAAVVALNEGIELARQGIAFYDATIGDAIDTALRFRKEGDESRATFEKLNRESELLKARIGDALIPVILGLREAFIQSRGSMHELIGANQQLIGSRLIDWIQAVGRGLIKGIAIPIELVAKAWIGWQLIIQQVKVFALEFVNSFRGEIAELLGQIADLAKFAGFDDVARKIAKVQKDLSAGIVTQEALDDAKKGLDETVGKLGEVELRLEQLKNTALDVFDAGIAKAQERVAEATKGTNLTLDEQKQKLADINEFVDKIGAKRQAQRERQLAISERDLGLIDTAQQNAAVDVRQQVADAAASALGDVGGVLQGFAAGGPIGGLIGLANAIVARSEALQKVLGTIGEAFGDIVEALDPLFEALAPLTQLVRDVTGIFIDAFAPVIEALAHIIRPITGTLKILGEIFVSLSPTMIQLRVVLAIWAKALSVLAGIIEDIANGMLDVIDSVKGTWNGIVIAIADVFRKLGDIEIFGKRPLGFLSQWANQFEHDSKITSDVINNWRREVSGDTSEIGDAADLMRVAARDSAEAMGEVASSLTNVPAGVKVALRRFQTTDPFTDGMAVPGTDSGGGISGLIDAITAFTTGGFGQTTNYYVDTVQVTGSVAIEEIMASVESETERTATAAAGSVAANAMPQRGTAAAAVVEAQAKSPLITGAIPLPKKQGIISRTAYATPWYG